MYQRILHDPLKFPDTHSSQSSNGDSSGTGTGMTPDARSIMTGLLQREPSKRLGAGGSEEIKRHPFFARWIDWNKWVVLLPFPSAFLLPPLRFPCFLLPPIFPPLNETHLLTTLPLPTQTLPKTTNPPIQTIRHLSNGRSQFRCGIYV
jgi:hypothetical protein